MTNIFQRDRSTTNQNNAATEKYHPSSCWTQPSAKGISTSAMGPPARNGRTGRTGRGFSGRKPSGWLGWLLVTVLAVPLVDEKCELDGTWSVFTSPVNILKRTSDAHGKPALNRDNI